MSQSEEESTHTKPQSLERYFLTFLLVEALMIVLPRTITTSENERISCVVFRTKRAKRRFELDARGTLLKPGFATQKACVHKKLSQKTKQIEKVLSTHKPKQTKQPLTHHPTTTTIIITITPSIKLLKKWKSEEEHVANNPFLTNKHQNNKTQQQTSKHHFPINLTNQYKPP